MFFSTIPGGEISGCLLGTSCIGHEIKEQLFQVGLMVPFEQFRGSSFILDLSFVDDGDS